MGSGGIFQQRAGVIIQRLLGVDKAASHCERMRLPLRRSNASGSQQCGPVQAAWPLSQAESGQFAEGEDESVAQQGSDQDQLELPFGEMQERCNAGKCAKWALNPVQEAKVRP